MNNENKFFEDVARLASSASGSLYEIKKQIDAQIKDQVQKFADKTENISKEDFEVIKEMAMKARKSQEKMAAKLKELEAQVKNSKK